MHLSVVRLFPWSHKGFRLDAQRIGDAVDVVEVGNHLRSIVNGAVVETVRAQNVEIGGHHRLRRVRQFFGEFAQCAVGSRKIGAAPVASEQMHKTVGCIVVGDAKVGDLSTEVVRVGAASIGAVIGGGDHRCQHLAPAAAER